VIERDLGEIESLATMVYQVRSTATVVLEAWLGRIKGVEVRFRDRRTPLRIVRADPAMTNARELIEAIVFRMGQIREVDAEIVNWNGKPLVRYIHWKGETPTPKSGKSLKVCLCCFMLLALMFGPILGFLARAEQRLYLLGSVPPQEITLQTLIEKGPGNNPHVTLTDFGFGGYVVESSHGSWSRVWLALFPTGNPGRFPRGRGEERKEIKGVLECNTIHDEAALNRFLQHKRITGLCSDVPGFRYGTLRTNLVEANPGSQLSSAWEIVELSEPPSMAKVQWIFLGSGACYALVLILSLIVVTRRS
jgi:hypothetical protein